MSPDGIHQLWRPEGISTNYKENGTAITVTVILYVHVLDTVIMMYRIFGSHRYM